VTGDPQLRRDEDVRWGDTPLEEVTAGAAHATPGYPGDPCLGPLGPYTDGAGYRCRSKGTPLMSNLSNRRIVLAERPSGPVELRHFKRLLRRFRRVLRTKC
jgi:hypothetical protein